MQSIATQLLARLVAMCPDFELAWKSEDNYFIDDDGTYSTHAVFTVFSRFVRDNFNAMPEAKRIEVMDFIESCLIEQSSENDYDDIDNECCTGFLENLSNEPPLSALLRRYMGPKSLRFFNFWDNPPA